MKKWDATWGDAEMNLISEDGKMWTGRIEFPDGTSFVGDISDEVANEIYAKMKAGIWGVSDL